MVFRGLDLVGNSMIGFQEEDRVFWFGSQLGQAVRGPWKNSVSVASSTRKLVSRVCQQRQSINIFFFFFFLLFLPPTPLLLFFFLKLQQACGYFLKEFSAKVVPLAILRSCPRFENMPNADVI